MSARYIFVGECRSATAVDRGWTWRDGHLAAKPLFEALEAMGIDPKAQRFLNLFRDPPNAVYYNPAAVARLRAANDIVVVAMGLRQSAGLAALGIEHRTIVHPAARGRIRKRERYVAHVAEVLS